jgi:hypothetical protein
MISHGSTHGRTERFLTGSVAAMCALVKPPLI